MLGERAFVEGNIGERRPAARRRRHDIAGLELHLRHAATLAGCGETRHSARFSAPCCTHIPGNGLRCAPGVVACLDEDTVVAFVDGRLEAEGRAAVVERHLADCAACAELVAAAAGADVTAALLPPSDDGRAAGARR